MKFIFKVYLYLFFYTISIVKYKLHLKLIYTFAYILFQIVEEFFLYIRDDVPRFSAEPYDGDKLKEARDKLRQYVSWPPPQTLQTYSMQFHICLWKSL